MMTLGVRELKARLSHHLRRAQRGTRVTITDRGRAIAVLSPIDAGPKLEWAHRMVATGQATWGGGKPAGLNPRLRTRGKSASQMLLEDRR